MRRLGRKCSAQFPLNGSLAFLLGPGGHSSGAGKATLNWRHSGGLVLPSRGTGISQNVKLGIRL